MDLEFAVDEEGDAWRPPFCGDGEDDRSMAPFATTPEARILEMINIARVGTGDVVCDLGAGDGSVLASVWEHAKACSGTGFEINKELVTQAQKTLNDRGCPTNSYRIVNQDIMEVDLSPFTVIFVWLQPWAVEMLAEKLGDAICANGARVVSYQWPIHGFKGRSFRTTVGVTQNMYLYELERTESTMP